MRNALKSIFVMIILIAFIVPAAFAQSAGDGSSQNSAPVIQADIPENPWSGTEHFTWSITDPDGDDVAYSILVSNDNGQTWQDTGYGDFLPLEGELMYDTTTSGNGEYLIMIYAVDEHGLSTTYISEVIEIVNEPVNEPENHAPVIEMSFPDGVLSGTITFEWSFTDPDNDSMTFQILASTDEGQTWYDTGYANLLDNHPELWIYELQYDTRTAEDGFYMFRIVAADEHDLTTVWTSRLFEINNSIVEPENHAPVFDAIGPFTVNETVELSFAVTATDEDNDTITITAENLPDGAVFDGENFIWTPDENQSGNYTIIFTATDRMNETSMDVAIEVLDTVNGTEPQPGEMAVTLTADPTSGVEPLTVNFTCSVENGTAPYTYTIGVVGGNSGGGGQLSPTNATSYSFEMTLYEGEYNVTCRVEDSEGSNASSTVGINVTEEPVVEPENHAPVFDAIGPFTVNETVELSFAVTASDADNDTVTITAENLPAGAVFDGENFTWTPDYNQSGNYTVIFTADDSQNQTSMDVAIEVLDAEEPAVFQCSDGADNDGDGLVDFPEDPGCADGNDDNETDEEPVNHAPVFEEIADIVIYEANTILIYVNATDPDGDNVTITASGVPDNAFFYGPEFGPLFENTFFWNPQYGEAGNYTVTFTATDGELNATMDVNIEVLPVAPEEQMHVFLTADAVEGAENLTVNFTCSVENGTSPYSYSWTVMDEELGNINMGSRMPVNESVFLFNETLEAGNYTATCTVSDSDDRTVISNEIDIIVSPAEPENNAPVFDAIGPFTVNESELLSFVVTAADEDNDTVTITAENMPEGAVFDRATFMWLPTYNQSGNYTVTFTATDGELNATMDVAIEVLEAGNVSEPENHAPVFYPTGPFTIDEGETLGYTVTAIDPDGDNVSISASGLPAGAVFENGTFTWTPDYSQSGNYTVTFTATDGMNETGMNVSITVLDANQPPVFSQYGPYTMYVNEHFGKRIWASDPEGDNVTITASNLPDGATYVNEWFDWVPNSQQTGAFTMTFTATDGTSQSTMNMTINVLEASSSGDGGGSGGGDDDDDDNNRHRGSGGFVYSGDSEDDNEHTSGGELEGSQDDDQGEDEDSDSGIITGDMTIEADKDNGDEKGAFPLAKATGIMLWLIALALACWMVYMYVAGKDSEDEFAENQDQPQQSDAYAYLSNTY